MDFDLIGTPLTRGTFSKPISFGSGVKIKQIAPILWELSAIAFTTISAEERREISKAKYWLVLEEPDQPVLSEPMDNKYMRVRHALEALQVIYPSGAKNIFLGFKNTLSGFDLAHSFHPQEMRPTFLSRWQTFDEAGLETDFDLVYAGISRSEHENIVRLQNPITLLELGLQADHPYISTLLWMMGLDMLFMAGGIKEFVPRVEAFLGSQTFVFPSLTHWSGFPRQPRLTISEVAEDAYLLRNIIAHGQAILPKYLVAFDLVDTQGESFEFGLGYAQILKETALFMLAAALRKIMVDGLVDEVKDTKAWRKRLKA